MDSTIDTHRQQMDLNYFGSLHVIKVGWKVHMEGGDVHELRVTARPVLGDTSLSFSSWLGPRTVPSNSLRVLFAFLFLAFGLLASRSFAKIDSRIEKRGSIGRVTNTPMRTCLRPSRNPVTLASSRHSGGPPKHDSARDWAYHSR